MTTRTTTTNRRAVLAALPALGLAPAAAPAGPPPGDTPILRLFRRHRAIVEAAHHHGPVDDDDDGYDRLFYREADAIAAEMMALPCTCAADFAAKVIVDTLEGSVFTSWETGELWREARELVGEAA